MLAVLFLNRMSRKRRQNELLKAAGKMGDSSDSDYCRTCMSKEQLVPIFNDNKLVEKRSHHLKLVTGLEIKINDGYSQQVCLECLQLITTALQFRKTCRKTDKALRNVNLSHNGAKVKKNKKKALIKTTKKEDVNPEYEFDVNVIGYNCDNDFNNDFTEDYTNYPVKEEVEDKAVAKQKGVRKKQGSIPVASSYKCNTCNKVFRMRATYKAHMRFHTNFCVCEACGKRCRNNNQLQEHKRARHGLGRIHTCEQCDYTAATKEALMIHSRRHTGERPYICDSCGASFHRRSNLVQHIAVHLPEKNFQCDICSKCEKSKKRLLIHTYKVHRTKRFRYVCPSCGESFSRPWNVRVHLARAHATPRPAQPTHIARVELSRP